MNVDFSIPDNGYYLLAAGIVAAFAGLTLLILARIKVAQGLRPLLAIPAVAAGAAAIVVEVSAYNHIGKLIPTFTGDLAIGYGLYVGIAGGIAAILGGLAALMRK
jgi:hypothetical protein